MARVAVVGAGPSGLAQLRAFELARRSGAEVPEVVCFEKQGDWGGLWNYTWRTGLDEHGDPVHGSMYRYLWSNGPKECLEFADYPFDEHFGKPIPSFPPREVLYDYIIGRATQSGVRDQIRFDTAVRWISFDDTTGQFSVTVDARDGGPQQTEQFDHVIVATGHFSTPNVPDYPGFRTFPGRIMHSHDFRDAGEFAGKDLLVVGGSYSAEDIALQSAKYGAKSVTISYRTSPMGFGWPENISEVPCLDHVDGRTAHFVDGTSREVDAIVMCTGYQHNFKFIADDLRLRTSNVLCTPDLYKGVFWTANPKMMYLAMQDQYYTFNMFDAQAWYARDVVLGQMQLPNPGVMIDDIQKWTADEEAVADAFQAIDFQTEYVRDLLKPTDYPRLDVDEVARMFKVWEHHKMENILTYRDKAFKSVLTGTLAPVHHTPWMKALDDSLETYLNQPGTKAAAE